MRPFGSRGRQAAQNEQALAAITAATASLDAPIAALHLPSLRANADDLRRRAGGVKIRVASKSVRCRAVLEEVLGSSLRGTAGFAGIMAYSLDEALWLVEQGCPDVLMGYPVVNRESLRQLGKSPAAMSAITLMVDDLRQLEIAADSGASGARVCLDVDSSLRCGPIHLGVRRSPLRTADQVRVLAQRAHNDGFDVVGAMFYEAQVAGVPDNRFGIGPVKKASLRRLLGLRQQVANAIGEVTGKEVEILNSGGSGSLAESASAPAVTEVTSGSGLFVPGLFDHYRSFTPRPALFFSLPALRNPAPGITTLGYGGYIASGPSGEDRFPVPALPADMPYIPVEGPGEVQTPIKTRITIGESTWWRHAKAGELCERFNGLHIVDEIDGEATVVDIWPTYRGEGKCFG